MEWLAVLGQAGRSPRGRAGLGLTALVVVIAAAGPFLAPHPSDALLTLPFGRPSGPFPLGGDVLRAATSRTGCSTAAGCCC